jgi:hypothetical protein
MKNSSTAPKIKIKQQIKLTARIKSINPQGVVIVVFSSDIIVPANITNIDVSVLRIEIQPGKESIPSDLAI